MKNNHTGKKVFGIILLVLSILFLPLTVFTAMLYFFKDLLKPLFDYLASIGIDGSNLESTISGTSLIAVIIFCGVNVLLLALAISLLCMSSNGAIARMHDIYGLKKDCAYRNVLRKPFIIIGIIALVGSTILYFVFKLDIIFYIMMGSIGVTVLGLLFLIPVPSNLAVKRRYKGNQYIVTIPSSPLIVGFNPAQILNELMAAEDMGYFTVEKIEDKSRSFEGRVRITFRSDLSLDELKQNRKEFHSEGKQALKNNEPFELLYDYEVEEQEGHDFSSSRDLHTKVTSTTTTYYTDGTKETHSGTKDVVTGKEVTYQKSHYDKYYFYRLDEDEDEESEESEKDYVYDEDDNILCICANWGKSVTGKVRTGYGN